MNFLERTLDYIFPPVCGICEKIGESYLCKECKQKLINLEYFLNQLNSYDNFNDSEFDEHLYIFAYSEIIRDIILKYKFQDKPYLSETFSEFFVKNEKACRFLKKYDIICAVPISNVRNRERGYNQSELIARNIGKTGLIHYEKNLLVKVKNNKPQSMLNKEQRLQNVKNVYKIQNEQKIKNRKIILFDDIYTTGATAKECAKLLKQAGASKVGVLTITKDFLNEKRKDKTWKI